MERVTGIGGVFFRARDPAALADWYAKHLGVPIEADQTYGTFTASEGDMTIFSTFATDTTYFGRSGQSSMVNFRVSDLDAMLAQLRDAGAEVDDETQNEPYGRFGWATDPEGNRFELWEPPA